MSFLDPLEKAGLIDLPHQQSGFIPHFQDAGRECQAALADVALLVEHGLGMLTVTGEDRAKFLHNFCTNDIKKMQPGDICEAFFCNVKGRILALGIILCQPNRVRILTDNSRIDFLYQHLDRYIIAEDVDLDVGDSTESLLVVGTEEKLNGMEAATSEIDAFPWDNGFRPARWFIGSADALVDAVKRRVAEGGVIAGHDAWEVIRISAGYPSYGVDISDENLAQEANRTEQAISFTKGCYLGQEPIARLDAMGHVNRQLERFTCHGSPPPAIGSAILTETGEEVGTVTSAQAAPPGYDISGMVLAMVKTKANQAETLTAKNADGQTVELTR